MIKFEQKDGALLKTRMRKAEKTERTQREMCKNIGISSQTLHKIFAGEVPKRFESIKKVTKYLFDKGL